MKFSDLIILNFSGVIMFFFLIGCTESKKLVENVTPPVAEKITKELILHGDTRIDDYYWLNERENPKVIEYLEAENVYREAVMKPTENLQAELYKEIVGRIKQEDMSVPYLDNGYYYYSRYEEGKEYPIYARKRETLEAAEEITLNVPEMAKGHDYYKVSGRNVSEDNNFISFGVDTVSRRRYDIYFKNLQTGELLPEILHNTSGYVVWANDNKTVFYTIKDETLRPHKLMKHILGQDPVTDVEVYHEKDNTFYLWASKTKTDKFIEIGSEHTLSTEIKLLEADHPDKPYITFQKREKDHEYAIYHHIDKFYIKTNWKAKNFRLMETEEGKTDKKYWKEVIPHRDDVLLQNISVFRDFLALGERKNGIRQRRVMNLIDPSDHYIEFDEESYVVYSSTNKIFDTNTLRYLYTSMTTPGSTYDYTMTSREKTLLKRSEVVGDFNPGDYISERLWATVRDDTKVPITIVYHKNTKKDGNSPLLIYGYGSYGSNTEPYFSSDRLSLLDRGFIYAVAHIRGGSEMGRYWYEDGKLLKKKNTFYDFIDCADFLVKENYTNSAKLFAAGGSAGGLLVGAVTNMRPDLFKGILASVPWVDVVTTMLDESIPLTTVEFDEWGNPIEKEYYDYMLSYSPYDNVEAKNYPALYVTTGLHDSQVQYFEPAKWVAKLRELKTDKNLILLEVDMESGHGGTTGRFKRYKRTARQYVFLLTQLDIWE
jgi:oligopeptidase B